MPELPEVETVVRQIRKKYTGLQIRSVQCKPCSIFQKVSNDEFAQALQGKKLMTVERYGKFLYWQVEEMYPVFHLGMSGIFVDNFLVSNYPQHIHIVFEFENGLYLYFQDVRKFGHITLFYHPPDFTHLGIDPINSDFTLNKFMELLNLKTMNVKSFLMDQKQIAGIGNIYANEILFEAGISPLRSIKEINGKETERLYTAIHKILTEAIERFGTTYTAYRTVDGTNGENQNFLNVYQLTGQPCIRCGQKIRKIIQNSRSTFYCEGCQL